MYPCFYGEYIRILSEKHKRWLLCMGYVIVWFVTLILSWKMQFCVDLQTRIWYNFRRNILFSCQIKAVSKCVGIYVVEHFLLRIVWVPCISSPLFSPSSTTSIYHFHTAYKYSNGRDMLHHTIFHCFAPPFLNIMKHSVETWIPFAGLYKVIYTSEICFMFSKIISKICLRWPKKLFSLSAEDCSFHHLLQR